MRTTLTLEPDVAVRLEKVRRERELSLKDVVNEALRIGLEQIERPVASTAEYRTTGWDLGACLLPDLDDVAAALAHAEGDQHK